MSLVCINDQLVAMQPLLYSSIVLIPCISNSLGIFTCYIVGSIIFKIYHCTIFFKIWLNWIYLAVMDSIRKVSSVPEVKQSCTHTSLHHRYRRSLYLCGQVAVHQCTLRPAGQVAAQVFLLIQPVPSSEENLKLICF